MKNINKEMSEVKELKEFKSTVEDKFQKCKINDAVLEKRIGQLEEHLKKTDSFIHTIAATTGGLENDQYMKLLADRAEKDINEK